MEIRSTCPLCQRKILSEQEQQYLKKSPKSLPADTTAERALTLLEMALEKNNDDLIDLIISKFDPSDVIHECIRKRDVTGINKLLKSKCINWHHTNKGKTLVDAAVESKDPIIKQLMMMKFKFV